MTNQDYLIKRYENYELEDEIKRLNDINNQLKKENKKLLKKNKKIEKENKHFKSTKAYKIWKKYAKIKDSNNKPKKEKPKAPESSEDVKNLKDIKVAFISDQFTYDSFKYEFNLISIHPKKWKEQFKKEKPDLFFCESTWHGHNYTGDKGPWDKKILKYYNNKGSRKILFKILEYCKKNNITTIFWNKEDPIHYRNEDVSAADTGQYFDYIFTSAAECVENYKKDFNHPNVYPLLFAGQPKLFNPLNLSGETIEELTFAGSYYPRHKERSRKMEEIFDKVLKEWKNIRIYDRFYYKNWTKYPDRYENYVHPPIDYDKTPELYKKMEWGLNLNTVTESRTMFARRIYELSLTNTNILTNYSIAVDELFGDNVFFFDKMDNLPEKNGNYEDKRLNNLYNVLENHTYANRWKYILDTIGFPYNENIDEINIIFKINDANDINNKINAIEEEFDKISYPYKKLSIIAPSIADNGIKSIKEKHPKIENIHLESDENYKKDIAKFIEENEIEYWIILDDDIDKDFIKKGLLHYQYLNKKVAISSGENKFKLGLENSLENKIINKSNLDYLNEEELNIDTYYI